MEEYFRRREQEWAALPCRVQDGQQIGGPCLQVGQASHVVGETRPPPVMQRHARAGREIEP